MSSGVRGPPARPTGQECYDTHADGHRAEDQLQDAETRRYPWAPVAATFYDDLARTRRSMQHVRVCEGTACVAADRGRHVADVERALGVSAGSCREDDSVSLQAVRCVGFCYAAPALLDGTAQHASPPVAKLTGVRAAAPPIPVAAIAKLLVLADILEGADPWQHWPEVVAVAGHPSSTPRCSRSTTSSHRGGIPRSSSGSCR
jgi:hypothetical protein